MKRKYGRWLLGVVGVMIVGWLTTSNSGSLMLNPLGDVQVIKEKPYDKYGLENLVERSDVPSKIELGKELTSGEGYKSHVFYYQSEGRRISGQINLPDPARSGPAGGFPVVVMARGYVDKEIYETGMGTKNAAGVYARNGFVTLAPDFSGYGESDQEDQNALGARVVKPVEILDLLANLDSLEIVDTTQIFLWGHSNGGQIMLSVAEILGKRQSANLPAQAGLSSRESIQGVTLWAPVSKPFPYNILYYTDELSDHGKWLRREIAVFEQDYDVYDYSIDRYLDWITVPLQIHQGGLDDAVPKKWSDTLVESLESKGKLVTYYVYPTADHNLRPNWESVVGRDLEFFSRD